MDVLLLFCCYFCCFVSMFSILWQFLLFYFYFYYFVAIFLIFCSEQRRIGFKGVMKMFGQVQSRLSGWWNLIKKKNSFIFFCRRRRLEMLSSNLNKGSFRLKQFCCDQGLMQWIAINWKFFQLFAASTALIAGCSWIDEV